MVPRVLVAKFEPIIFKDNRTKTKFCLRPSITHFQNTPRRIISIKARGREEGAYGVEIDTLRII